MNYHDANNVFPTQIGFPIQHDHARIGFATGHASELAAADPAPDGADCTSIKRVQLLVGFRRRQRLELAPKHHGALHQGRHLHLPELRRRRDTDPEGGLFPQCGSALRDRCASRSRTTRATWAITPRSTPPILRTIGWEFTNSYGDPTANTTMPTARGMFWRGRWRWA